MHLWYIKEMLISCSKTSSFRFTQARSPRCIPSIIVYIQQLAPLSSTPSYDDNEVMIGSLKPSPSTKHRVNYHQTTTAYRYVGPLFGYLHWPRTVYFRYDKVLDSIRIISVLVLFLVCYNWEESRTGHLPNATD